jgi:hypothetical protein
MKDIKPKDDILLLLERARIDHEPQFFAEVDKRFPSRRKPKNLAELNKILDSVLTDDQA